MDTDVLVVGEALIDIVTGRTATANSWAAVLRTSRWALPGRANGTRLLTRVGDDERGRRIAEHIGRSGARLDERSFSGEPTSTARARLRADGSAEYDFAITWDARDRRRRSARRARRPHRLDRAVSRTGGAAVLETLRAARTAGAIVSVDPNIRPALVGDHAAALARFGEAAASADLVKLSDEDAHWLYPDLDDEEVLDEIAALGPRLVVLTRGAEGLRARPARTGRGRAARRDGRRHDRRGRCRDGEPRVERADDDRLFTSP